MQAEWTLQRLLYLEVSIHRKQARGRRCQSWFISLDVAAVHRVIYDNSVSSHPLRILQRHPGFFYSTGFLLPKSTQQHASMNLQGSGIEITAEAWKSRRRVRQVRQASSPCHYEVRRPPGRGHMGSILLLERCFVLRAAPVRVSNSGRRLLMLQSAPCLCWFASTPQSLSPCTSH